MRRALGVLVAALISGAPSSSGAKEHPLEASLVLQEDRVTATLDLVPAFSDAFRRRVAGGLESRVEILSELADRNGEVVGQGRRTCRLLYSLWDEHIYVQVDDQGGETPDVATFEALEDALRACARIEGLPVALAGALTLADGYRLRVRVVLNPVSEELVERSRQFISNPSGGAQGRSDTVLGAVAHLFSREGGALGDTTNFETEPLDRPTGLDRLEAQGRPLTSESSTQGAADAARTARGPP